MKIAKYIAFFLIALMVLILLAVVFIDENRLKGYIEQQLTDITGREVTIAGDFDIDLGWTSRVRLEGLHLSNAAWSKQSKMLQMSALEVGIELKSLLLGRIIIPEVMVERPRILLETSGNGRSNWNFSRSQTADSRKTGMPELPIIRSLTIKEGKIRYLDRSQDIDVQATLESVLASNGRGEDIDIRAQGQIRNQPYNLAIKSGPLAALSQPEQTYAVDMNLHIGTLTATVSGTIDRPLKLQGVDLKLVFYGTDLDSLAALIQADLSELPAYRLTGTLTGSEQSWRLNDMQASVGDHTVSGSLQYELRDGRHRIAAELDSERLDITRMMDSLSADDDDEPSKEPFSAAFAAVSGHLQSVILPGILLEDYEFKLMLDQGRLQIDQQVEDGAIRSRLVLDVDAAPQARADITFEKLDLGALLNSKDRLGILDGHIELTLDEMTTRISEIVTQLRIDESRLAYRLPEADMAIGATLAMIRSEDEPGLEVQGELRHRNRQVDFTVAAGPLPGFGRPQGPYAIEVALTHDQTPLHLKTKLSFDENTWTLSDLEASTADSDLRGSVRVSIGGDRPKLSADLSSQKLDLQPILGLAAAADASAEDNNEEKARVIDIFRMADADLDFRAKRILTPDLKLADIDLHLKLQDGLLTIKPLKFDAYEGHIEGEISLDGRRHPIDGSIDTRFDRLNVEKIIGRFGVSDRPFGRLGGELKLKVTGRAAEPAAQGVFLPSIGRLDIKKSRLHYVETDGNTDITLQIDAEGLAQNGQVTRIDGSGQYRGEPFELSFRGDPLLDLREPQDPFALEMSLGIAQTQSQIDGEFLWPLELKGFDIDLTVAGPNPRRLYPLTGISLPDLPPYRINGRLSLEDRVWQFEDFEGRVGDSDVRGDIYLDVSGERPFMRFNLVSDQTDFDDLAGLVGAAPASGPGETVAAEHKKEARQEFRTESVLPADQYNMQRLRAIDAVVDFKGKHLQAPNLPLDDMQVKFRLDAGRMVFDPLRFDVGGGFVRAKMTVDTNEEFLQGRLETEIEKVDLKKVLSPFEIADDSLGIVGGRAKFWVKGNSIADFAASADGGLNLLMGGGKLDRLLIELAGFDGGEALLELIGEEQQVPIDCAYADLQAKNGIVALKTFAVDTSDTLFTVSGTFDLAKETLDLTVQPRPKDVSLFSARSPLRVAGTFNAPEFYPDASSLASRGAVAVGLGLLAGPAALIPLIEPGLGQDSVYCQGLVKAMESARRQTKPEEDIQ